METTFYDDGRSSFVQSGSSNKDEVRKRLTLDLNSPRLKKPRFDVLLSSPDLNMLKLPSPELEKLIMQQNGLLSATPTPNGFIYPTSTGSGNNNSQQQMGVVTNGNNNPRAVTRDQEMYVRGFDDALAELHQQAQHNHQNNIMETGSSNNNAQLQATPFTSNNNNNNSSANRPPSSSSPYIPNSGPLGLQIPVKEEPRCGTSLSSSPPMSPIDMENQERIKLERKRQRNRIAASKCRRRKLERIARLEDKVKVLKNDNSELAAVVVKLRQQVCGLKEQVMEHISCGCQIMLTNQF